METWTILLSVLTGCVGIYYFCFKGLNHFKNAGLPHMRPVPVFGNLLKPVLTMESVADLLKRMYDQFPDAKYVGMYDMMTPAVMIRDTDLIKSIAVKNFEQFRNHRTFVDAEQDPLFGKNLFALHDDKWREGRNMLSPAFTGSKMKGMFPLMSSYAADFAEYLSKLPESERKLVNVKDAFTKYTNDVIATCAFGIRIDSMKDPRNEFYLMGKEATNFGVYQTIVFLVCRSLPTIAKLLNMKIVSTKIGNFFKDTIAATIRMRNEKGIRRSDMIQLMMDANNNQGKNLSIEDITSQAFIFFFGGFDSTSTTMCFAAHEIAVNPDVQDRLRNEIDEVLASHDGKLTYEALHEMEYLDAVTNETLRMYPVMILADRACSKSFELPPTLPGAKPYTVEKGDIVWFPTYAMQRDPKHFENPDTFDPDRFMDKSKKLINHPAFMPFGIGPRMCIGNRFAVMEIKILLFHLLAKCVLKPSAKTRIPLRLSSKGFSMNADGGFWLHIEERTDAPRAKLISVSNGNYEQQAI